MLQSKLPDNMMEAMRSGTLSVLSKPGGGVRPIVSSDAFLQLLARAIVVKEQKRLASDLAPLQAGVGLKGGVEFIIHSVRHLLHTHDNWVAISIDCKNAYGSILLSAIQQQLRLIKYGKADLVSTYFDLFVSKVRVIKPWNSSSNAAASSFYVRDGLIQGDPLSPLLFALGLQPVLKAAQSMLPGGHVFAYLDDVVLVGPVESAFAAFQVFKDNAASIGLHVNTSKTKVLSLNVVPAPIPSTSTTQQDSFHQMDQSSSSSTSSINCSGSTVLSSFLASTIHMHRHSWISCWHPQG